MSSSASTRGRSRAAFGRFPRVIAAAVVLLVLGGVAAAVLLREEPSEPPAGLPEQLAPSAPGPTPEALEAAPEPGPESPPLRWAPPPGWEHFEALRLPREGGRLRLDERTDYRVVAPERVQGPVEIIGGRHIVWIGGHIDIGIDGEEEPRPRGTALIVRDGEHARRGRIVHIEGLLLDGGGLTEGIDLDAPSADIRIQNVRVEEVRFAGADDRDGTGPYEGEGQNHPDVLQTFGGHRELRVDGLSARSGYQGLLLKVDHDDGRGGPVHLRRVDLEATEFEGVDGFRYAGNRMYFWDADSIGDQYLERGTVWIRPHRNAGKVAHEPNQRDGSGGWWHVAYRDGDVLSADPAPGTARFTDAVERLEAGEGVVEPWVGRDRIGRYLWWPVPATADVAAVLDASGLRPGRIYAGTPPGGPYVPRGVAGVDYESPGYAPGSET